MVHLTQSDHDADLRAFAAGMFVRGPRVRDFGKAIGKGSTVAQYRLMLLEELGYITRRRDSFVLTPGGRIRLRNIGVDVDALMREITGG